MHASINQNEKEISAVQLKYTALSFKLHYEYS